MQVQINLTTIGKRYNTEWIFKNISCDFSSDEAYVLLGGNGSGKSTLLQIIGGNFLPSTGTIAYNIGGNNISDDKIFRYVSYATPYLELTEDFTIVELLQFHKQFKTLLPSISDKDFIELADFTKVQNKAIKYFSSGMKQRLKLALAILSDTPIVLLDEPVSNLDRKAIDWYQQLISNYKKDRLFIVCSNQIKDEYNFCTKEVLIEDYKK